RTLVWGPGGRPPRVPHRDPRAQRDRERVAVPGPVQPLAPPLRARDLGHGALPGGTADPAPAHVVVRGLPPRPLFHLRPRALRPRPSLRSAHGRAAPPPAAPGRGRAAHAALPGLDG